MEISDYFFYHFNTDPSKVTFEVSYHRLLKEFMAAKGPFKDVDDFITKIIAFGAGYVDSNKVLETLEELYKERNNENAEKNNER